MLKVAIVSLASVALLAASRPTSVVPIWDGSLAPPASVKGELCNVAVITPGKPVSVRNGPGAGYEAGSVLVAGTPVYTCNSWGRRWVGIAYPSAALPCKGALPDGIDVRLTRECESGWAPSNRVEILSG